MKILENITFSVIISGLILQLTHSELSGHQKILNVELSWIFHHNLAFACVCVFVLVRMQNLSLSFHMT